MKKTIISLNIVCIICLLLSSCSTSYMTKRHYMKGFYVEHKKHNNAPAVAQNNQKPAPALEQKNIQLPVNSNEPELMSGAVAQNDAVIENSSVSPETPGIADDEPALAKSKPGKKGKFASAFKTAGKNFFISPFNVKATAEKIGGPEGGLIAATLSLFWIVIVVLLVLYLIGIAFEGFGIGPLFHLMAVIILVLLILWLLGIV
jgi:hypothetical protein